MTLWGSTSSSYAGRLRDLLRRNSLDAMQSEYATRRYGSVISIDTASGTCQVKFPENADTVTVRYGSSRPSEIGQQVRVEGQGGDLWIAEVLGYVIYTGLPADSLLAVSLSSVIAGYGTLIATWDHTLGYPEYKVEWAEDASFTVSVTSTVTNSRESQVITSLVAGTDYWVRLYAGNGEGDFGPVGPAIGPTTPLTGIATDGSVPSAATTPTILDGIKQFTASWTPVVNDDAVSYEVHISTSNLDTFPPPGGGGGATMLTETTLSFVVITTDATGAALTIDTDYYVKILAKDGDGVASAYSPQATGQAHLVELGDVGNVPYSAITDGLIPDPVANAGKPYTPTLTTGPGFIMANWQHQTNPDQLTYEIHMHTASFTPTGSTYYVQETTSNFCYIKVDAAGAALSYTNTYYIQIIMKDLDGLAADGPSAEVSATVPYVEVTDIKPLVLGTAFIDEANIVDLAVTNAKIGALAVDTAQIANLAVENAQIGNLAVDTAQIANGAIEDLQVGSLSAAKITTGTLNAARIGAGTISASTIIMENSASSILKSGNFVSGSAGWQIKGNGDAEFQGLTVDSIFAGSGNASTTINTSGQLFSGNTVYGSAPFRVANNGDTVVADLTCTDLTVTGTHNISSASITTSGTNTITYNGTTGMDVAGDITLTSGGNFNTAVSGHRMVFSYGGLGLSGSIGGASGTYALIKFYDATGTDHSAFYGDDSVIGFGNSSGAGMDVSGANIGIASTSTGFVQLTGGSSGGYVDLNSADIRCGNNIKITGDNTNPEIRSTSGNLRLQSAGTFGEINLGDSSNHLKVLGNHTNPYVRPNSGIFRLASSADSECIGIQTGSTVHMRLPVQSGTTVTFASAGAGLKQIGVASSSTRWKSNIEVLDADAAMDVVRQIDPISYISDIECDHHDQRFGFSAENLDGVDKALAFRDDEDLPAAVDHLAVMGTMLAAVKNIDERLAQLENA